MLPVHAEVGPKGGRRQNRVEGDGAGPTQLDDGSKAPIKRMFESLNQQLGLGQYVPDSSSVFMPVFYASGLGCFSRVR